MTRISRAHAASVFAVAVGLRFAYMVWSGPHRAPDSAAYEGLASALLSSHHFDLNGNPIAYPPLYPSFLAALQLFRLTSTVSFAIVQSLLDSVVAVVVFGLASRVAAPPLALASALAYAVHPGAIYISDQILTEALFTAMLSLGVILLVNGLERESILATASAGLAFGAATLTRSLTLLLPVALALAIWFVVRPHRWRDQVVALVIGAAVVVVPWVARCSSLAGHIVLVQGRMAINFYVPTRYDLNQADYINTWTATDRDQRIWWNEVAAGGPPPADVPSVIAWKVVEADRRGMHHAFANVASDPLAYLRSRARTFPYLFLTSFDSFTGINQSFGNLRRLGLYGQLLVKGALLASFCVLPLVLACRGLLATQTIVGTIAGTVWLYGLAVHAPLWIEYRFWQPFVPFMLISACIGFGDLTVWRSPAAVSNGSLVAIR